MRKEKDNTDHQISKFIQFRQAVYECGFIRQKDAWFKLLDALKDQPCGKVVRLSKGLNQPNPVCFAT